jgi:hypothetical protein
LLKWAIAGHRKVSTYEDFQMKPFHEAVCKYGQSQVTTMAVCMPQRQPVRMWLLLSRSRCTGRGWYIPITVRTSHCVTAPLQKAAKPRSSGGRCQDRDGATVPVAVQEVICGGIPSQGALMDRLPQRPRELFLTAYIQTPRTICERI